LPSVPSVRTMKRPSRRKKVLSMPCCLKLASAKLPSTLVSLASCIAS